MNNKDQILFNFKLNKNYLDQDYYLSSSNQEASGVKYVPKELISEWTKKDPISNYETFLVESKLITKNDVAEIKNNYTEEINRNLEMAFNEPSLKPDIKTELKEVYKEYLFKKVKHSNKTSNIRFVDAISQGLLQSMEKEIGRASCRERV